MTQRLFLFAGEPSGDLHGSHLYRELKLQFPDAIIEGVAGPLMRAEGMEGLWRVEDFSVMGFTDVIFALPRLVKKFYQIKKHILKTDPAAVILIDYPGFNLRLAKALRNANFKGKIVHYICPTVWAHGKGRIQHMAETLDLLLTIFPFEKQHFANTPLKVEFVGNPLVEGLQQYPYSENWKAELNLPKKPLVAIFPGSRSGEIARNLPTQLEALKVLKEKHSEAAFGLSCSSEEMQPEILKIIEKSALKDVYLIPKKYTYELMRDSHSALAKSGTVTLELALHKRPTAVVYALSPLNRFIAKYLLRLKLPYYCIVNILGNKEIFPEMIEKGFDANTILKHSLDLFVEGPKRDACLKDCLEVAKQLHSGRTSQIAAQKIKELIC